MSKTSTQIKNYSKMAAVILSSSSVGNAAIIYTDIVPDTTLSTDGSVYNIDLNNDNIQDFSVSLDIDSAYQSAGFQNVSGNNYVSSGGDVRVLSAGITISSSIYSSSYWGSDLGTGAYKDNLGFLGINSSSTNGPWQGGQSNKFVGVRFDISGSTHFGWIRLSIPIGFGSVTVHDYAYESVAGVSIVTGDTASTTPTIIVNTIDLSGCDMVSVFGNSYTSSQVVNDTVVGGSSSGLDSVTIANITIFSPAMSSSSLEECDDAIINGNTYSTSQTVIDTLVGASANGCDSIHTTNLVINNSETINIDTSIVQGGSITIDGNIITTAGTYSETLQNAEGCDSTINYTVSVIQGIDKDIIENIDIYPNPAKDKIMVDAGPISLDISQIKIVDLQGKELVLINDLNTTNKEVDVSNLDRGVYFLVVYLQTGEYQVTRLTKI